MPFLPRCLLTWKCLPYNHQKVMMLGLWVKGHSFLPLTTRVFVSQMAAVSKDTALSSKQRVWLAFIFPVS